MTLLQAVALVAGAIGASVVAAWLTRKANPEGWGVPAVAAVVVLLVGLAFIQGMKPSDEDTQAGPQPAESADGATGTPVTPQITAPSATPTTTMSTTPPVMATSLLDLPIAAEDTNDSIDLNDAESTEVNGTNYGRLLVYECSLYCDGGSPQVREVTLGGKYGNFEATFAVLDTATGRHRLDVTLDGARPMTFWAEPGKPTLLMMDVEGVSRMRFQLFSPGPLKSPIQAGADTAVGANGGGLPGAALGDPMLIP